MCGSRKFFQRASNFEFFFFSFVLVDEGIQVLIKAGHHWLASETPFKWCFAGVPKMAQYCMLAWHVIYQWIRTSIAKKPYIFVIFQGKVRTLYPPPPPLCLDLRMRVHPYNVGFILIKPLSCHYFCPEDVCCTSD